MFACSTIEDSQYLDVYMEDECWTGDHLKYTLCIALPSFIIWGIGLPLLAFTIIHKLHIFKKLDSAKNKEVYGFIFLGYMP